VAHEQAPDGVPGPVQLLVRHARLARPGQTLALERGARHGHGGGRSKALVAQKIGNRGVGHGSHCQPSADGPSEGGWRHDND